MAHLGKHAAQRIAFPCELPPQEFLPAAQLLPKDSTARLPGQRQPREKRGPFALDAPVLAFQGIGQCRQAFLCRREALLFWAARSVCAFYLSQQPEPREFFERVIDLRPRNGCPVANFAAFQFTIRLIAVHGQLGEQAQQDQIGGSKVAALSCFQLETPLRDRAESAFFRFLLHHHHWHCSAGRRGLPAWATAEWRVSNTQMSWCWRATRPSLSYSAFGSCFAKWATLRMPSSSKSLSMAGPMEIRSFSLRFFIQLLDSHASYN